MGDTDFITQFHNIKGDLVSDRRRNFFKLLKENSASLNEGVINNLCPKTYLENVFQIDILIYLKKTTRLLEILKGGNDIFVSKIIKQPWFFKEAFKELSAEQLVNEFLPCTSFALRMKILKKLSFNVEETHMDAIFDCVNKRYGIYMALKILHTCTAQKIKEILAAHEVKLDPNQVQAIFDKDQELFQMYLQHYKQITKEYYYHGKVFKYIALKNPELWLHLKKTKYVRHCKLGRRLSKKIIGLVKTDILDHTDHYSDFLREDVIVRKLHGNFKDIYFKYFPESMDNLRMTNFCNILLRYYPKKKQWYMFSETFSRVFANKSILDNLIYLDSSFLNIFPNKDIMHMWAENHYKKKHDHWLWKYYDVTKGIPLIKEKINVTSDIRERYNLVMLLLEICAKNDDLDSLETVLKYICFRHRNEEASFRDKLLRNIKNMFKLDDLNEDHWKCINEQITILRLRNEFSYYSHIIFIRKYLEYLFLNGKPFRDEIIQYITEIVSENKSFLVNSDNPAIEKDILIQIANFSLDSIENIKTKDKNRHCSTLVTDIIDFSRCKPDFSINLLDFPNLILYVESSFVKGEDMSLIEQILLYNEQFPEKAVKIKGATILDVILKNKDKSAVLRIVGILVKKRNRSELENETLKIFWDIFVNSDTRWDHINVITWFFENEPRTVVPYFDKILEKTLSCSFTYFDSSNIKLMSHFAFDTKMMEFYLKELSNVDYVIKKTLLGVCVTQQEDEISKFYSQRWLSSYYSLKENVIKRLSKLMNTEDFINIVAERFIPVKEKLDLDERENMEVYKLQCEVVTSLKKLPEPAKVLPTVIKFCLGDYLQSALTSLYSVSYRSPEKMLCSYIDILLKRAVSVRKHAVFLCCELLNFNFTVNILKSLRYDNVSSQKHLFSAALKFFLKNPSEDLLNLVILNLNTIDKNDEETLNSLVHINMPQKYKTLYIEKCWKFFEDLKNKEADINKFLNSILDSVIYPDILVSLSRGFCEHIINNYFKERKEDLYHIDLFVCKFLKYRKIEQEENFNFIFEIVNISSKNYRKRFFKTFYEIATDSLNNKTDISNNNFIQLFKQNWERLFTPSVMFDQHILLKLLILKYEIADPFVENYAKHTVSLLEQLVSDFGPYIYYKFQKLLNETLNFEIKTDKYLFLYNILKTKTTPVNCILVLDLMNKYYGKSEEIKTVYNKILDILKNVKDPVVVVHYNSYLD